MATFATLLEKLRSAPMQKEVFKQYVAQCAGLLSDVDTQLEILKTYGFPFVELDDSFALGTRFIHWREAKFCFVDIETTGAKPKDSQIIEIGAIQYQDGVIIDTFESYVYAPIVPDEISTLTGIYAKDLANAPSQKEVLGKFRLFLQDCIFVAHNVEFDYNFLDFSFQQHAIAGLLCPRLCTIDLAKQCILSPRYSLSFLNTFLGINTPTSHRAYADALTALEVFKIASLCIPDSIQSVQDLIDFSKIGRVFSPQK